MESSHCEGGEELGYVESKVPISRGRITHSVSSSYPCSLLSIHVQMSSFGCHPYTSVSERLLMARKRIRKEESPSRLGFRFLIEEGRRFGF